MICDKVGASLQTDRIRCESSRLELSAAEQLATAGGPKNIRKFRATVYSGAAVARMYGMLVIDIATLQLPDKPTPIAYQHFEPVGYTEKYSVVDGKVIAEGYLLVGEPGDETADMIASKADRNYPWEMSISCELDAALLPEGQTMVVNGRQIEGPCYVTSAARIRESSFVMLGADADTESEMLHHAPQRAKDLTMKLNVFGKGGAVTQSPTIANCTIEQLQTLRPDLFADNAGDAATAPTAADLGAGGAEQPAASPAANSGASVVANLTVTNIAELEAAAPDEPALVLQAVKNGWSVEKLKGALCDKLRAALTAKDAEIAKAKRDGELALQAAGHKGVGPGSSVRGDAAPTEGAKQLAKFNANDPNAAWAGSEQLRKAWTARCKGDEALAHTAFLKFAASEIDDACDWRETALS